MTIPYRHLRFLLSIPSRTSVIQHRVYRNPRDTVKRYSNNLSDTCDSRRVGRHKTRHAPNFPEQFSIAPSSKSNSLTLQNDPNSNLFPANPRSYEEQGSGRTGARRRLPNSRTRAYKRSPDENSANRSAEEKKIRQLNGLLNIGAQDGQDQ